MDTRLRVTVLSLELQRRQIAQALMQPLTIIEPFNERKDLPARVVSGAIPLVMDQLILEDAEETFRDRIVVAVAFAAHTGRQPQCRELPLIRQHCIGRPDPCDG